MLLRLAAALALFAVPLASQTTLVVDASGRLGKYRTVIAAIQAAKDGDTILIHPGTYVGTLNTQGKAIALLGFTGNAWDVVIRAPKGSALALDVPGLKAGGTLRVHSLSLDSGLEKGLAVNLRTGKGDVYLENIWSNMSWSVPSWSGTVSMSRCLLKIPQLVLNQPTFAATFYGVPNLILRDCAIECGFGTHLFYPSIGVLMSACKVEITQTSIKGPDGINNGSRYATDAGPALILRNCAARICGDGRDVIVGGQSQMFNGSNGGTGVRLNVTTLDWSGTTIRGGPATGSGGQGVPFELHNGSRATRMTPAIPRLRPRGLVARGAATTMDVLASPNALSLTWLSTSIRPVHTPLGILGVDLTQPRIELVLPHDATGKASFPIDLRGLPLAFRGVPFVVQSLAVSRALEPVLSAPFVKVLR